MAKGIKKIVWTGKGRVFNGKEGSIPNKLLVVAPDEFIIFKIGEWYPDTTEKDKAKDIKWAVQTTQGKIEIQKIISSKNHFGFKIPKALCGPYTWYIEASWSGNFDGKSGLQIKGRTPTRIINSSWSKVEGGKDVRKEYHFSYGELVWLRLYTEGLNGFGNVKVHVYRRLRAGFGLLRKDDEITRKVYSVQVIKGQINLKIPNTYSWGESIKDKKDVEEFYVQVVHPITGEYIPDDRGDTAHARFLRIKNKVVSQVIELPQNRAPLTIYEPDKNASKYELCRFEQIKITEAGKPSIFVFDNGAGALNPTNPRERVVEPIYFEFGKATLTAESLKKLNSILKFILEHRGSSIRLDGYACAIGKQFNNKELSEDRAQVVKNFFDKGGLEKDRIITKGYGELNPTDDKSGRDNIKYRDEKNYILNRRVDISFEYYGHDAKTIVYETILGSTPTNIKIEPVNHDTKACFINPKHKKEITFSNSSTGKIKGNIIPAKSSLSAGNLLPFDYIWPKNRITNGNNSFSSANEYLVDFHSCRYYSVKNKAPLLIKVYPDIEWELTFEFKIKASNYKAANMPAGNVFKKHQEKARQAGYESWLLEKESGRGGLTTITLGVGLSAEWNDKKTKRTLSIEKKERIQALAEALAKLVNLLQDAINYAQSAAKATAIPMGFDMRYPNMVFTGKWSLEQENGAVHTKGELNIGLKPIIGAEVIIDILGMAIAAGSYAATGNPAAAKLIQNFRGTLDKLGASVTFTATFYGELEIEMEALKIAKGEIKTDGKTTIGGKMGVEVELSIEIGGKFKAEDKKWVLNFKASAKIKGQAYFGGDFVFNKDEKGFYVEPILKFSGLIIEGEIEGEVGWWKCNFKLEEKVLKDDTYPLKRTYL